ncbi:MAG: glycosyltransferase [Syntrophobacteraceae bacterium]
MRSSKTIKDSERSRTRVLFITSASHTPSDRNLNHFQRVYFLSRSTDLTVFARKGADFSVSAAPGTRVIRSPWPRKAGQIAYAALLFLNGRARQYDIIVTEPSILGMLGFLGKLFGGCRWAVDVWDIPIRNILVPGWIISLRCRLMRGLFRALYRWADLFIVSILPDFELREFMIPPERMLLLKNAIWRDESRKIAKVVPKRENFSLLCMRSVYTPQMGLDTLVEAMLILWGKAPDISLTVIGRIPSHIEPQVAPLRGMSTVRFLDFVEHAELTRMIGEASVCVVPFHDVPDLAQTYPVKIIEYLAHGKPVVASNIAGINRMLSDGQNGLLFRAGDPLDLAAKILLLHRDPELRRRLAKNAGRLDDDFDCCVKNRLIVQALERLAGSAV